MSVKQGGMIVPNIRSVIIMMAVSFVIVLPAFKQELMDLPILHVRISMRKWFEYFCKYFCFRKKLLIAMNHGIVHCGESWMWCRRRMPQHHWICYVRLCYRLCSRRWWSGLVQAYQTTPFWNNYGPRGRGRLRTNREQDCIDFDECANNQHNCDVEKSSCSNTPGSFECPCIIGYKMIDQECQGRFWKTFRGLRK